MKPSLPTMDEIAEKLQIQYGHVNELFSNPRVIEEVKARAARLTG